MPRPIHVPQDQPGITSYTLGPQEEFTVLAVSFTLTPIAGSGGDNFAYLDMRDPAGGIIYLQPLTPSDGADMFYSLAPGSEPYITPDAPDPNFPQNSDGAGFYYAMQRFSPQTLYANCTLNVYKVLFNTSPPTDPITAVSPHYLIPDLHLWVEDVAAAPLEPIASGPYMLVGGPNA